MKALCGELGRTLVKPCQHTPERSNIPAPKGKGLAFVRPFQRHAMLSGQCFAQRVLTYPCGRGNSAISDV